MVNSSLGSRVKRAIDNREDSIFAEINNLISNVTQELGNTRASSAEIKEATVDALYSLLDRMNSSDDAEEPLVVDEVRDVTVVVKGNMVLQVSNNNELDKEMDNLRSEAEFHGLTDVEVSGDYADGVATETEDCDQDEDCDYSR